MVVGWRLAVPGAAQTVRDAAWLAELQLCKCGGDLEQNEQVLLLHLIQDELLDSTQGYSMLLAAIATSAAYSQLGAFYMSTLTRGLRFSMYGARTKSLELLGYIRAGCGMSGNRNCRVRDFHNCGVREVLRG